MNGGEGRLDLVWTRQPGARQPGGEAKSFVGLRPIPGRPVLVLQKHHAAIRGYAGVTPGVLEQHRRKKSGHLRLVGHELHGHPPQPNSLRAQVATHKVVPAAGGVTLVEHQVDDCEDGGEPLREKVVRRNPSRYPSVADLALGAHQSLRQGRLRHQEHSRDLGRGQAAKGPKGQCHTGLDVQRRKAAREDEPQPVVPEQRV